MDTKSSYCPRCSKVTSHTKVSKNTMDYRCDDCGRVS